jgi:hypothetical protein
LAVINLQILLTRDCGTVGGLLILLLFDDDIDELELELGVKSELIIKELAEVVETNTSGK